MCKCSRCKLEIDINEGYFSAMDEEMLKVGYYCPKCWAFIIKLEQGNKDGVHLGKL